ncbi:hypothetical protein C7974DRAFT_236000 [Boeremia exigua]|uniref:uncharacterized protein n=1 Tax=Boeremia exigua TaxID=749465 RepID=UPI001E8E663D|nr:uncharacterized protein C7974DRAFT_236000 [Boeremia exigua]KAH6620558.1 hypothetical protein C7974DRAFT_236000 [Boeremia exigua]
MSTTRTTAAHAVLRDYELTHSPETPATLTTPLDASLNAHAAPAAPDAPLGWPTQHRRVPPHRPVNTQLDQGARRVYQNGIERAFIGVMFTGVFLQSTASKVWRNSLGGVWGVGYKLGGEW